MYLGLDKKSRRLKKHLIKHHAKYLGSYINSMDAFGGNTDFFYRCKHRYYVLNVTDDFYESWQNCVCEISKAEFLKIIEDYPSFYYSNKDISTHPLFNKEYENGVHYHMMNKPHKRR